ncbi:MAG: hypothetical protein WCF36_21675 [Candidatus Nanopelagicales bacterium]
MSADAVMLKIQRFLSEEDLFVRLSGDGLVVPYDSTAVFISVLEQKERSLVRFTAPVILEAPDTPELTRWVATDGQQYFFGAAALRMRAEGTVDVVLDHTLLGDFLDREELHAVIGALANTANDLDEQLKGKFGGRRLNEDDL